MKITISQDFNSVEAAEEFLARRFGQPFSSAVAPVKNPPVEASQAAQAPVAAAPLIPNRARKPRSDAGQARGPYKPRDSVSAPVPPEAEPGAPSAPVGMAVTAPTAPPAAASAAAPQAGSPGEASDLTVEALRETLGRLQKTPGKGVEACLAAIKQFGVTRISDLPKERYAEFDGYVRSLLQEGP